MSNAVLQFRTEYAAHRAAEGRKLSPEEVEQLPYLTSGAHVKQWAVRARSFDVFMTRVLEPAARGRQLGIADLGAGNGWLSTRLRSAGHEAVAVDLRTDDVDGLGSCSLESSRAAASFEALPFVDSAFDMVVFNAALHYALDLSATLREAMRVAPHIVIIDSPFYARESDGTAMVVEKHERADATYGNRADALLALPFVEFLTRDRLRAAAPQLNWTRHLVHYPLWYELRPFVAQMRGMRMPSRFDVWEARA